MSLLSEGNKIIIRHFNNNNFMPEDNEITHLIL